MDRLQESIWQCTPFMDNQMPPDVQDPPSTENIHMAKCGWLKDQYDTCS